MNKEAFKLSPAWVDRIFDRLAEIYGERWTSQFKKPELVLLAKKQWSTGLYGLSGDEIKKVLHLCLNNVIQAPPSVILFYHYAKSYRLPPPVKESPKKAPAEVREKYMSKIRETINANARNHSYAALSKKS